jgi:hypothetical protein
MRSMRVRAVVGGLALLAVCGVQPNAQPSAQPNVRPEAYRLTKEADAFLEDLSKRSFMYFWEQADPKTGLVRDR